MRTKPRGGGTLTEAQYWSKVRSALRKAFRWWPPAIEALEKAKRNSKSKNKRLKYEYQCSDCKKWFPRKDVEIDHTIPVGSLKCDEDLVGWLKRLTPETSDAYTIKCLACHRIKTNNERKGI